MAWPSLKFTTMRQESVDSNQQFCAEYNAENQHCYGQDTIHRGHRSIRDGDLEGTADAGSLQTNSEYKPGSIWHRQPPWAPTFRSANFREKNIFFDNNELYNN